MKPSSSMRKITRRQALAGGAGVIIAGSAGASGRYALGDTFESHVAGILGLPLEQTKDLLRTMRDEIDTYDFRAAGFLAATTTPGKELMPESARRKAVESFIGPLFDIQAAFVTPQVYIGYKQDGRFSPCSAIGAPGAPARS